LKVLTVDPEEVFERSGLPRVAPTFSHSVGILLEASRATSSATLKQRLQLTTDENYLALWRELISGMVGEIIRKTVAEYVDQYYESAEESASYRYMAEAISAGSAQRLRAIREKKFGDQECFVIYTPEELRDFF
jgi:CRISPR/Cas system-associated endonuclease Cas1